MNTTTPGLGFQHPGPASRAVFLSYASQDAEVANRIADALREAGVEVWFDQMELRGGDAWDRSIRRQIRECALFVPMISANTQAREEGYFRREWKLAVDRTHDMADHVPFLLPLVLDDIKEGDAHVPEAFHQVQWSWLKSGAVPSAFVLRVRWLVGLDTVPPRRSSGDGGSRPPMPRRRRLPLWPIALLAAAGLAVGAYFKWPLTAAQRAAAEELKSIAVLPFDNIGGDSGNRAFTDGIHEDILTSLAKIRDLKVISRTSVLAYRDPLTRNLRKIAGELGVATVLEGSVQRDGNKVRVTAQLINARTDEHLWAESYDRDFTDIFALQGSLAREIAHTLKASLTRGERALLQRRLTQDPQAYEFYLAALVREDVLTSRSSRDRFEEVSAGYEQAIARDANFPLPYARLAALHGQMYFLDSLDATPARRARSQAALETAQRLAPKAPETHYARGAFAYFCENDWVRAMNEYRAAEAGLPNDAQLITKMGLALRRAGKFADALDCLERASELNPHDLYTGTQLMTSLYIMRRYPEVLAAARRYDALHPNIPWVRENLVRAQFALDGDHAAYLRDRVACPRQENDRDGVLAAYQVAFLAGDLAVAARALDDPRLKGVPGLDLVISDPVPLHRAMVAFLRGEGDLARQHADQAIAIFQRRTDWAPRQQPLVRLGIARAHTYAGRRAEAVRDSQAVSNEISGRDPYLGGVYVRFELARNWAALERGDDAIACLREMFSGPSAMSANEVRHDPVFARLRSDPRLEEILKDAKPL